MADENPRVAKFRRGRDARLRSNPGQQIADQEALDRINLLLSAADWPGPSGLEDIQDIVRLTGREPVPNAPAWWRH